MVILMLVCDSAAFFLWPDCPTKNKAKNHRNNSSHCQYYRLKQQKQCGSEKEFSELADQIVPTDEAPYQWPEQFAPSVFVLVALDRYQTAALLQMTEQHHDLPVRAETL